ncbi:MAG: cryptochrome/photolyase family protein [Candidatus Dadabacteria bacterium]|nr:cryptochrome/photolyase family protein [Candidatus Dadabacteria bacterium]NIT13129.1 cryptochrome/photolyase family protein [Candidatus Dadabacteria bacterium]
MRFKRLAIILGNCLYSDHKILKPDIDTIFFMAEDFGLCSNYKYHKHKLVLILSAMRSHRDQISKKHKIEYFELSGSNKDLSFEDKLSNTIKKYGVQEITTYYIENRFMRKRIEDFCKYKNIKLAIHSSPGFLTSNEQFREYSNSYKRLLMNDFYIWQRKRLGILINKDGGPANGKWSFDTENRKKLPKNIEVPRLLEIKRTKHTEEVSDLIEKLFADYPGRTSNFFLPTTREQALLWFEDFLTKRFLNFGAYEDALSKEKNFLFHSLISPLMNIGLLTPCEVISSSLDFYDRKNLAYQSLEGFVRQIIGWREFIRGVYNTKNLRGNFFDNQRKLTDKWYLGKTGIPPLDTVIKRVIENAYAHHIERLMVISNMMLLTEINPDEVYRWFMELFVDSSDWVMEPNVYGMGQFADGGTFATKPYISGSSYILKISDFERGEWCDIWDGLYWRFINKNRDFFLKNQRMSMMIRMFDKIDKDRKRKIISLAENFINDTSC